MVIVESNSRALSLTSKKLIKNPDIPFSKVRELLKLPIANDSLQHDLLTSYGSGSQMFLLYTLPKKVFKAGTSLLFPFDITLLFFKLNACMGIEHFDGQFLSILDHVSHDVFIDGNFVFQSLA